MGVEEDERRAEQVAVEGDAFQFSGPIHGHRCEAEVPDGVECGDVHPEVRSGNPLHAVDFGPIETLFRHSAYRTSASPDLDEVPLGVPAQDEIDLATSAVPVVLDEGEAPVSKGSSDKLLSPATESNFSFSHTTILVLVLSYATG